MRKWIMCDVEWKRNYCLHSFIVGMIVNFLFFFSCKIHMCVCVYEMICYCRCRCCWCWWISLCLIKTSSSSFVPIQIVNLSLIIVVLCEIDAICICHVNLGKFSRIGSTKHHTSSLHWIQSFKLIQWWFQTNTHTLNYSIR